jgi:hypothetical protein
MSDLTYDGMLRVAFVPTIANIAAPTVAELTAGTDLTPRLAPDGVARSADTGTVDTTKMSSTANTQMVGRRSFTASVTYQRGTDEPATEVEEALTYRAAGYLVVRTSVTYETPWASAQKIEVYPVQVGEANPGTPGPDTVQTVEVPLTVTDTPRTITSPAVIAA